MFLLVISRSASLKFEGQLWRRVCDCLGVEEVAKVISPGGRKFTGADFILRIFIKSFEVV